MFRLNRLFLLFLIVFALFLLPVVATAQDTSPVPVPVPSSFDLQLVLAAGIAYLLYTITLAAAVQTGINQLKPLFLDPVKNRKDAPTDGPDNVYLVYIYAFRATLTTLAYFYLWGGVVATRAVIPLLPAFVPDPGIAIVTIAFVVLGEEIIHPLLDRLYALRDAAGLLKEIEPQPTVNVTVTDSTGAEVSKQVVVGGGRYA